MEEKKLTDEEIVKALYICTTADDDMDCIDGCPMYEEDYCTTKLLKMAFDLIQRLQGEKAEQKAEIKRLTERLAYFQKSSDYHEGNQKELEAQNAELQKQVDEQRHLVAIACDEFAKTKLKLEQAVKDTAKKFADLVEFHSIARMNDGVEYFTISALGLKEILVEEFGFKYSELNGVEVE